MYEGGAGAAETGQQKEHGGSPDRDYGDTTLLYTSLITIYAQQQNTNIYYILLNIIYSC